MGHFCCAEGAEVGVRWEIVSFDGLAHGRSNSGSGHWYPLSGISLMMGLGHEIDERDCGPDGQACMARFETAMPAITAVAGAV